MADYKSNVPHLRMAQRAIWSDSNTLRANDRLVGAYLLNRMDDTYDNAFPSTQKIALDTGLSLDAVYRATKVLVETGIFERRPRPGGQGSFIYSVDLDKLYAAIELSRKVEEIRRSARRSQRPLANSDGSLTATPGSQRPLANSDGSLTAEATGRCERQRGVAHSGTEKDHLSDQNKGKEEGPLPGAILKKGDDQTNTTSDGRDAVKPKPAKSTVADATSFQDKIKSSILANMKPANSPDEYVVKDATHYNPANGTLTLINGAGAEFAADLLARNPGISIEAVLKDAAPWCKPGQSDVQRRQAIERSAQKARPSKSPTPRTFGEHKPGYSGPNRRFE